MSRRVILFALISALSMPLAWGSGGTGYSLSNMPNPDNMVANTTPGQSGDDIQPDNGGMVVHLFRQGEGWNNGTEDSGCDWNTGQGGCSFNDARDCQIAGQFNTCDLEILVNGTYTQTNPNTGQQSCNNQNSNGVECKHNVMQVTINWGDGTTTTASYEHNPSSNPNDPQNVPTYYSTHTYTSLPNGAPGSYPILVTENVGGTWVNTTTYTYQPEVIWNLANDYYGNGACSYGWSGTNQMTVSTSAASDSSGYLEAIDFSPTSGFSGATNITGATQVCSEGCGNSGIGGSGDSLYPISYPCGSSQQVAYGSNIVLDTSNATWSGGPLTVGNYWGWFVFTITSPNTITITYNGANVGTITAVNEQIAHVTPVLEGGENYSQTLSVYVYSDTPPPLQEGQELASPSETTPSEQP